MGNFIHFWQAANRTRVGEKISNLARIVKNDQENTTKEGFCPKKFLGGRGAINVKIPVFGVFLLFISIEREMSKLGTFRPFISLIFLEKLVLYIERVKLWGLPENFSFLPHPTYILSAGGKIPDLRD